MIKFIFHYILLLIKRRQTDACKDLIEFNSREKCDKNCSYRENIEFSCSSNILFKKIPKITLVLDYLRLNQALKKLT